MGTNAPEADVHIKNYIEVGKSENQGADLLLETVYTENGTPYGLYSKWKIDNTGINGLVFSYANNNQTNFTPKFYLDEGRMSFNNIFWVNGTDMSYNNNFRVNAEGYITARSFHVTMNSWKDFAFNPEFQLPSLEELQKYISKYRHLPGVLSEKEVLETGINLGENQTVLLQKIEELTLYILQLNQRIRELEARQE